MSLVLDKDCLFCIDVINWLVMEFDWDDELIGGILENFLEYIGVCLDD